MIKLLDFLLCGIVTMAELIAVVAIALIVQAVFYRIFKINLYKIICNKMMEL